MFAQTIGDPWVTLNQVLQHARSDSVSELMGRVVSQENERAVSNLWNERYEGKNHPELDQPTAHSIMLSVLSLSQLFALLRHVLFR